MPQDTVAVYIGTYVNLYGKNFNQMSDCPVYMVGMTGKGQ